MAIEKEITALNSKLLKDTLIHLSTVPLAASRGLMWISFESSDLGTCPRKTELIHELPAENRHEHHTLLFAAALYRHQNIIFKVPLIRHAIFFRTNFLFD